MSAALLCVDEQSVITGWDFSTGGVKCLAFDVRGETLAEVRLPTDLWRGRDEDGRLVDPRIYELNLLQLEGQARASVRAMVAELRRVKRLDHWVAGGISATHHTAGRIDAQHNQVRRAICWNDQTLADYRAKGEKRLGGKKKVQELLGGPWADRYSLSHLVKDEETLSAESWRKTARILLHGPLAAGYLTGEFNKTSVSSAASTGIMDFRTKKWNLEMLGALAHAEYRELARKQLPKIVDQSEPLGPLAAHLAVENGLDPDRLPLIFPTSDDQQAGLAGGGAVDNGEMAIILGNSAVVNSSSKDVPTAGNLDVMRLNWGPYLWMRCYSNGAQFVDRITNPNPNWTKKEWRALDDAARAVPVGCGGTNVLPFALSEPSLGISQPSLNWSPQEPVDRAIRRRAALEALACLIALGVKAHERAGQSVRQISVSGGMARSELMCDILASVLGRELVLLESDEGPALGAAATALAALETHRRKERKIPGKFTVADAIGQMVRPRGTVSPTTEWQSDYRRELRQFEQRLAAARKESPSPR